MMTIDNLQSAVGRPAGSNEWRGQAWTWISGGRNQHQREDFQWWKHAGTISTISWFFGVPFQRTQCSSPLKCQGGGVRGECPMTIISDIGWQQHQSCEYRKRHGIRFIHMFVNDDVIPHVILMTSIMVIRWFREQKRHDWLPATMETDDYGCRWSSNMGTVKPRGALNLELLS